MTRMGYALLLCLLLLSCGPKPDERTVFRGKKNGQPFQKVVVDTFDSDGNKLTRRLQDYNFDPKRKMWIPVGPPRRLDNAAINAEIANMQSYNGDESNPPASASIATPSYIYLANNGGDNDVIVLDARTLALVTRIPVPGFMYALAVSPDGRTVAVPSANRVIFIDVLTNRAARTLILPTGSSTRGLHFSLDGSRLFLTDVAAGMRIVRVSDATLLQTVPLPTGVVQLDSSAISPDREYIFVRAAGFASTTIFDVTTLSFTVGASVGRAILTSEIPCAFHATGKELYCISTVGIAIFDAATMTFTASIALPAGEFPVRLYAVDGGDYILHATNKAIRMIDPASREILATLNPEPRHTFTSAYPVSIF